APESAEVAGQAQGEAGFGQQQGVAAQAVASAEGNAGSAAAPAAQQTAAFDPARMISELSGAITSAWQMWQRMAPFSGAAVNGPVGFGGRLPGPPLEPLILAQAPKATAAELRLSTAVATAFSTAFMQWQATVKLPGMPLWPAFAAFPGPVAPPT